MYKIGIMFFCKCLEFRNAVNSQVKPLGLEFSLWEDFKLYIKFFNTLRVIEIFYCFFRQFW